MSKNLSPGLGPINFRKPDPVNDQDRERSAFAEAAQADRDRIKAERSGGKPPRPPCPECGKALHPFINRCFKCDPPNKRGIKMAPRVKPDAPEAAASPPFDTGAAETVRTTAASGPSTPSPGRPVSPPRPPSDEVFPILCPDPEIAAMSTVAGVLDGLDFEQVRRVLAWYGDRRGLVCVLGPRPV